MSPNSDIIRFSPTPAFTARMLALPALGDAVNRALDVFDNTKSRKDAIGAALRAAEASMRVAASGALPLATPIVNTVGGWGVVDDWACRGLDRVEKVAPIIKKPTKDIVTTTRQSVLKAVAGGNGLAPESLTEAITTRANSAAELMASSRGGKVVLTATDQVLVSAHNLVDTYLPAKRGDRQGQGVPAGNITIKISSLVNKARQRLYRSAYVLIRPPNDSSLDGTITITMIIEFSRRTAADFYAEVLREPKQGEEQSVSMALARSTVKLTKQYTDQVRDLLVKQFGSLKTMDRENFVKLMQDMMKSSMDMTSNAGVFMQGGMSAMTSSLGNIMQNAGQYRTYFEDMLRKAMSDYEQRERAARAAAAASSWRKKNQMERVASPPPSEEIMEATGPSTKSKTPIWQKKMMGRN